MSGEPDPLYIAARHALLDALDGLGLHRTAVVLVGAQAVYIHAGEADLAVAPYTTDGDLAIDPQQLASAPLIEEAMTSVGFELSTSDVGVWQRQMTVSGVPRRMEVDLLVPDSLGGMGRRSARIPPHASRSARKVVGLEGVLIDWDERDISSLEPGDDRSFRIRVAGPAALVVAKVHKIADRLENVGRRDDKDALDVYRLLRVVPEAVIAEGFARLRADELSRDVTETAISHFRALFASGNAVGIQMAQRAAGPLEDADILGESLLALSGDMLKIL